MAARICKDVLTGVPRFSTKPVISPRMTRTTSISINVNPSQFFRGLKGGVFSPRIIQRRMAAMATRKAGGRSRLTTGGRRFKIAWKTPSCRCTVLAPSSPVTSPNVRCQGKPGPCARTMPQGHDARTMEDSNGLDQDMCPCTLPRRLPLSSRRMMVKRRGERQRPLLSGSAAAKIMKGGLTQTQIRATGGSGQ